MKRRSRIKRLVKKAEYVAMGFTMVTLIYTAMVINLAGSKKRKEWI